MLTINDYLDNILEEFEDYVYSGVRLCDLKSVHFDAGKIPDYSNIHVQQLYLLRYAFFSWIRSTDPQKNKIDMAAPSQGRQSYTLL